MGTFIANKLFVIDNTEDKKPICYNNASLEYTEMGIEENTRKIIILRNKKGKKIHKLPKNFKIVLFDDWCGSLIYLPNISVEKGKCICYPDTIVCDNGEKIETRFAIRHHFDFLKKNGVELKNNDF